MKKTILVLSAVAILATVASTAKADVTQITLGPSASGSITFTGDGSGGFSISLTPDPLTGTAWGTGDVASGPVPYTVTQGNSNSVTGTSTGADSWAIGQSSPFAFNYGAGLLTGNLQLLDITQISNVGVTNTALVANLSNLDGSLASNFTPAGGILSITIDLSTAASLASLGKGATETARISSGELFPTPEPGTLALLGSGILALGGYVRRKVRA